MKVFNLILLLTFSLNLFGQKANQIQNEQIDRITKSWYEKYSTDFKKKIFLSGKEEGYTIPWDRKFYTEKELRNYLEILKENVSLEIENKDSNRQNLIISTYLCEEKNNSLFESLDFELILQSQENKSVQTLQSNIKNYASGQKCLQNDSHSLKTIEASFNIPTSRSIQSRDNFLFNMKFHSGFEYSMITEDNINRPIVLDNFKLEIIDIIDNKIVIFQKNKIEGYWIVLVS